MEGVEVLDGSGRVNGGTTVNSRSDSDDDGEEWREEAAVEGWYSEMELFRVIGSAVVNERNRGSDSGGTRGVGSQADNASEEP